MTTEPRYFRVRWRLLGGHYHVRIFSGQHPDGSFTMLGKLILDENDWAALAHILAASDLVTILGESS